jgi:hypothetical protein
VDLFGIGNGYSSDPLLIQDRFALDQMRIFPRTVTELPSANDLSFLFIDGTYLRTSRYAAGFMRRTNTALHRSTCALTNPFQAERGPVTSPKVENATFPGRRQCSRGATRVKPAQARRLRRSTRLDPVLYRLGLNFPAIRGMSLSNLNHSFVTRAGSESSVFMLSFSVRSLHEPANHT